MAESEGLKIGRSLFFCFLKVLGEFAWDGKRKQNLRSGVGSQCSSLSRIILLTLRTIPSALLSPLTTCRDLKTHPMTVAQAAMMLFPRVDEWVVGLVLEALGLGVGFQSEISAPGRTDGAGQATMGSQEPAGVSSVVQGRRWPRLTPCWYHNLEVMQGRAHRWEGWDGTHRDTGCGCR